MGAKTAGTQRRSLQARSSLGWRAILSTSRALRRQRIAKSLATSAALMSLVSGHLVHADVAATKEIGSVLTHPIFGQAYACSEHGADSATWDPGDAFGTDCFIQKLGKIDGRSWERFYRGSGNHNEDWYGWRQDVLSPCTCEVMDIHVNPVTNSPGVMGTEPASIIKLKRTDGVVFVVVHCI